MKPASAITMTKMRNIQSAVLKPIKYAPEFNTHEVTLHEKITIDSITSNEN